MRAAVYYGNNKVGIEDVPEPAVTDCHVKIKVSRNGICGTDLHEYYDVRIFIPPAALRSLDGHCPSSHSVRRHRVGGRGREDGK